MNDFFTFLSASGTVVSAIFVYLTYKVYKKSLDTKLYVISKIEKVDNDSENDSRYFFRDKDSFKGLSFETEGFPLSKFHHEKQRWNLYIHNKGELPAAKVEVKYRITIFKNHINYGIDETDIQDYYLEEYVSSDDVECIDYLPPGAVHCVPLIFLEGEFPKAILQVLDFRCNENVFIKDKTDIGFYEHPSRYMLADSFDISKFVGANCIRKNKVKSG
ncbi:hypothetical protein [Bacillus pseudomycoides]|uniref:hypothetical protein n=1 Tax=Bacillus pseudomycoides TaxID=64104 RepID=UPI000BEC7A77|nr:hypothetical protein [Bacillus pseudomycoides]PEE42841.1 hypothetical protein COO02_05845 [Bacillus pseudomycoides]